MPVGYQTFGHTFRDHHPGWELRTWTDTNLPPLRHQDLYMRLIRRASRPVKGIYVRSYVQRDPHNERRNQSHPVDRDRRLAERRRADCALVEESYTYVRNGRIVDQQIHHPRTVTSP